MEIQFYILDIRIVNNTFVAIFFNSPKVSPIPEEDYEKHILEQVRKMYGTEVECSFTKDIGNKIIKERFPEKYEMAKHLALRELAQYN